MLKIKGFLLKWVKHPFIYISVIAGVWLLIFDNYNLLKRYNDIKSLSQLEQERDYYKEQIKQIKIKQKDLLTNQKTMERFARETYFMKKDSEDLFIFVEPKSEEN